MVITLVIDIFGDPNNGTTVTARRTASYLQDLGNEVRIIGWMSPKSEPDFLKRFKILRCRKTKFSNLSVVAENGFTFGTATEKEIADFIKGSDVVHLFFPFPLEAKVRKVAKAMGIAVTSAFHVQPENISFNIHRGKIAPVNLLIYRLFYNWLYKFTRTIHTPSETMKDLRVEHHYPNEIYPISNGMVPRFHPKKEEKPAELKDKFVILMVGRLAGEKRQDLIIKAIGKSKYNKNIQLILCGQGPKRKHYRKLSKKYLANPCEFRFVKQDELRKIINYSDLYIHASDAESEAIACIEAFACGKVPVISDSKYSATNHFSLDSRCLFKAGDPNSLKDRIDYFYEHPEVRPELSEKYIEFSKTFDITNKVKELDQRMKDEYDKNEEDKKLNRTYYTSIAERRHLKRTAKKAGIENPYIVKKDIYHQKKHK